MWFPSGLSARDTSRQGLVRGTGTQNQPGAVVVITGHSYSGTDIPIEQDHRNYQEQSVVTNGHSCTDNNEAVKQGTH